jgi:hypothetical protein
VSAQITLERDGTAQSGRHIIVATAFCNGALLSSSVLV